MNIFHLNDIEENALNYTNDAPLELLFSNKVSLDDSIDEYKKNFYKIDMITIIKNLNERLGKVAQYDYN